MNIVLDDAAEYNVKTGARKQLGKAFFYMSFYVWFFDFAGRILLKGDCITLIQRLHQVESMEQDE